MTLNTTFNGCKNSSLGQLKQKTFSGSMGDVLAANYSLGESFLQGIGTNGSPFSQTM